MLFKCESCKFPAMFQAVCLFALTTLSCGETLQTMSEENWKPIEGSKANIVESAGQVPYNANPPSMATHLTPLANSPHTSYQQSPSSLSQQLLPIYSAQKIPSEIDRMSTSDYLPSVVKPHSIYYDGKQATVAFAAPVAHSSSPDISSQHNVQPFLVPSMDISQIPFTMFYTFF